MAGETGRTLNQLFREMNYISVENLTKTYGIVTLFEDISFNINEGDKIAIVAKNGSGKTTLLNILMGKDFADSGTVIINKDIQVVLFDQEIHFESGQTITEFIMSLDSPPMQALRNYQKSLTSDDSEFMERAFIEMENQKAWGLENEMKQILSQLKITDLNGQPLWRADKTRSPRQTPDRNKSGAQAHAAHHG